MQSRSKYTLLQKLLFALNLVFVFLLIFSLLTAYIPPSIAPLFAVFGLLYPPLLFANIAFIVFWLISKPKFALVSLLTILIGFNNLSDNFQFSFSETEESNSKNIKVLTYNVQRFGLDVSAEESLKNRERVIQFLEDEEPDIICLQEYHGKGKTLYEPLQELKTRLGASTYYYESYFNPRYQQLTGLVIFSRYEAINKGKLKFDGSRTFGIFTDVLLNRDTVRVYNIHLASIQLMHSDIDFVVNPGQDQEKFSLHASKIYSKLTDAFQLRELQMDYLMQEIRDCPYPIILNGDFNDTPSSFVYGNISNLLEDTFVEKGRGFSITYAGKIPFLRIDYVMKSEHFNTTSYGRHRIGYSDHYPVSSIIAIN